MAGIRPVFDIAPYGGALRPPGFDKKAGRNGWSFAPLETTP
jgi:hypothetical protein